MYAPGPTSKAAQMETLLRRTQEHLARQIAISGGPQAAPLMAELLADIVTLIGDAGPAHPLRD